MNYEVHFKRHLRSAREMEVQGAKASLLFALFSVTIKLL